MQGIASGGQWAEGQMFKMDKVSSLKEIGLFSVYQLYLFIQI
jgi:hypothetical protein